LGQFLRLREWDGTDEPGAHVAGGVYVGRLETAQGSRTRKLLVVR
jgi:hypothetical protein